MVWLICKEGILKMWGPCHRCEQPLKGFKEGHDSVLQELWDMWLKGQIPGIQYLVVNGSAWR